MFKKFVAGIAKLPQTLPKTFNVIFNEAKKIKQ